MNDLEELQRMLGGSAGSRAGEQWLSTQHDGVSVIIVHHVPYPLRTPRIEIRLATHACRELDLWHKSTMEASWTLDGERTLLRLPHGFVFLGCPGGVLRATSTYTVSEDQVIAALEVLALWARQPWQPDDWTAVSEQQRRERRRRWLTRGTLAATLLLIVVGFVRRR